MTDHDCPNCESQARELAATRDLLREAQEIIIERTAAFNEMRASLGLALEAFHEACKQRDALGEVFEVMSYPKGNG